MKRKNFKIEFEKDGVTQTWQGRSTGQKVFFKIQRVD